MDAIILPIAGMTDTPSDVIFHVIDIVSSSSADRSVNGINRHDVGFHINISYTNREIVCHHV